MDKNTLRCIDDFLGDNCAFLAFRLVILRLVMFDRRPSRMAGEEGGRCVEPTARVADPLIAGPRPHK